MLRSSVRSLRRTRRTVPRPRTRAPVPRTALSSSPAAATSFLSGTNALYVDELFSKWKADPSSVHASWDAFFKTGGAVQAPPPGTALQASAATPMSPTTADLQMKIVQMVSVPPSSWRDGTGRRLAALGGGRNTAPPSLCVSDRTP